MAVLFHFQVHCEMLSAEEGTIKGLQLWVNLAKEFKMVEPEYQEHSPDEIATMSTEGVKVKGTTFLKNRLIRHSYLMTLMRFFSPHPQ